MLRATTSRLVAVQTRSYAADAKVAKKKAMKAPVTVRGKAGEFAMRFFEDAFAREGDAGVVRLEKELAVLEWSVRDLTAWRVQTTSPFFDLKWKREQITKRLTAQGLSPLLIDLVMDLVAQGEIRRLQQVRTDYDEIMRGYRREVDVTLTTAKPLSADRLALLKRSIQVDYLKPEDNLIFAHSVDDSLGGGYKVFIKGQEHDHSWAAAVRAAEAENTRIVNAPREKFSAAPRPVTISGDELIKSALGEKETQGWLPADLFARSEQLDKSRTKGSSSKAKILQALKSRKSSSA
jgi:F0F1-type ATP synthase delta subunit